LLVDRAIVTEGVTARVAKLSPSMVSSIKSIISNQPSICSSKISKI
jgi:hypothetical protein